MRGGFLSGFTPGQIVRLWLSGENAVNAVGLQWWAEEIAKLAPIGTMLIALVAATIALRSLRAQRDIARKRAALDLMLKIITEKTMIDFRLKAGAALAAHEERDSDEKFASSEHLAVLRGIIEFLELVAVGIKTKVVDEDICFETLGGFMVETIRVTKYFITAEAEHILLNLGPIAERWSERLEKIKE